MLSNIWISVIVYIPIGLGSDDIKFVEACLRFLRTILTSSVAPVDDVVFEVCTMVHCIKNSNKKKKQIVGFKIFGSVANGNRTPFF